MFAIVRTAFRFFFIGFGVGVLMAPRSGSETRALIREKLNWAVDSVLEVADLPPIDEGGRRTEPTKLKARRTEGTGAGAS